MTHHSPDSNPPVLWGQTRSKITRHVALGGSAGAVGQRLMAVLIVVVLHMHFTAGDQTLAVALTTAGRALQPRVNHQHEITKGFLTNQTRL